MRPMKTKQLLLFAAMVMMLATISCNKDGKDDGETDKEITISALKGTWALDIATSFFGNTGIDASDLTVTFAETGYSFTGEITTYVSGGTYTVADDGSISEVTVDMVPSNIELDGTAQVSLNDAMDEIQVVFSVKEKTARINGLGDYQLVFKKQ